MLPTRADVVSPAPYRGFLLHPHSSPSSPWLVPSPLWAFPPIPAVERDLAPESRVGGCGGGGCGSISGLSGPSGLLCWSSVSSCPRLGQKSLVRGPQKSLPGTLPFFLCCGASHLLSLWPPTLLSSRASHHASNSLVPNQAQTSPPTPMSPPLP